MSTPYRGRLALSPLCLALRNLCNPLGRGEVLSCGCQVFGREVRVQLHQIPRRGIASLSGPEARAQVHQHFDRLRVAVEGGGKLQKGFPSAVWYVYRRVLPSLAPFLPLIPDDLGTSALSKGCATVRRGCVVDNRPLPQSTSYGLAYCAAFAPPCACATLLPPPCPVNPSRSTRLTAKHPADACAVADPTPRRRDGDTGTATAARHCGSAG